MTLNGFTLTGGGHAGVSNAYLPDPDIDNDAFGISSYGAGYAFGVSVWGPDKLWLANTNLPGAFPFALVQGHIPDPNSDEGGFLLPAGEFWFSSQQAPQGSRAVLLSISTANVGTVPEPATWAIMILGFGFIGSAMRARKLEAGFGLW